MSLQDEIDSLMPIPPPTCDLDNAGYYLSKSIALEERLSLISKELKWIADQYDDSISANSLAMRLYDVSCTARILLKAAEKPDD